MFFFKLEVTKLIRYVPLIFVEVEFINKILPLQKLSQYNIVKLKKNSIFFIL